ncbi:hypothetical protein ED236_02655 [Pseudomethylobacillus aquaticus]|uniref:Uncharacterized protein n=1 Tax=Pseudomethylobacillus aquaticus TaxID=2676064 RepID=A0A3N0V6R6_9PROT|nr:hypothetical protein [Pseudomethylobacillus aquaticus]ROH88375.1 hypothetical protein ED236_02655 [Pseudomethylobacillus aquaticus]
MSSASQNPELPWSKSRRGDRTLDIRISRNTLVAAIASILVHAVLLFFFFPTTPLMPPSGATTPSKEIVVQLSPPPARQAEPPPPVEAPVLQPPPKPRPAKRAPAPKAPPVMAVDKPPVDEPPVQTRPLPPPPPPAQPDSAEPTDMMSYIAAARARREREERLAAIENADAVARERGPTEEERRDAIIKRNLQGRDSNGGMFLVLSKNSRSATIRFNGWKGDYSISKQETYEIEPGADGDINKAIIRRVIERIRQDNPGDFPWESRRLGRTVTLSARREDNAGLEDFLMEEFFGTRGRSFNP